MTEELRRNGWQVMKDVLMAAQSGAILTKIYYAANSNYQHLQGFLDRALASHLIRKDGRRFYTTDKGREFILRILDIEAMIETE